VLHGGPEPVDYEVVFEVGEDTLSITVEDRGEGYDVEGYVEPVPGEIQEGGGLGIFIIRALMDEVDIRSEVGAGTFICMKKRLLAQAV